MPSPHLIPYIETPEASKRNWLIDQFPSSVPHAPEMFGGFKNPSVSNIRLSWYTRKVKKVEHWRRVASGLDFFIENIYTEGMLACKHQCKVDTLGNDAQLFRVIQNDDDTFAFQPSGTPLVVAAGEGAELEAQHSDPSVDAAFLLRPIDSECESL
ncbi:hypothetical protein N7449_011795 [Penicillium cf. viridicatum]|uniref:Uncharacterized protein n=1 Tax=Penicillium cf. viridicatum TaxID=2972119 RepID=A0A9W9IM66_9EURO|nr:hypothetical protein N7449_011795 [Penicillium cf. viridicatum]